MNNKISLMSWLIPASISGVIGVATIFVANKNNANQEESFKLSQRQHIEQLADQQEQNEKTLTTQLRIDQRQQIFDKANIMLAVISAASNFDEKKANILIKHVLTDISSEEDRFDLQVDLQPIYEASSPVAEVDAKDIELAKTSSVSERSSSAYPELVNDFKSEQRLVNSNTLLDLYPKDKQGVVESLIAGLLPDDDKWSYRVNIYIVLTLARISEGWVGSEQQFALINALESSKHYRNDSTFQRRVNEAIKNYLKG